VKKKKLEERKMERRALGKGINALIPEKETGEKENIFYAKIEEIQPNPLQPRKEFSEESLKALAQSIKEKGIIQPLIVQRKGDFYELIAGERRWRAAKLLNLKEIPVMIKEAPNQNSLELSLIENLQREDLNPIEEAHAYQYLIEKFQMTQEDLSEKLGKARASIANTLRLLNLPQEVQEEIRKGRLTFGHGRALLEIEDINQQRLLAQIAISKGLSVRELESLVKARKLKTSKQKMRLKPERPSYLVVWEEELKQILATQVRIIQTRKRGNIRIDFYSSQDLERIIELLRKIKEK